MSLSISDFQKISNGVHNAGDITLTGRGKLDMVNNHVGVLKGWNTKTISAATTLEVKNAFVQALKNAGIDEVALAGVREELGLSRNGSTKGLDLSTLKPLTRAQTREILDRFAGVINEKAGNTVISNRWDALKAADIVGYRNILARAAEVNEKSAATRAASQRKLGMDILDNGADSIPARIRNSTAYSGLSALNKEKFAKIFTAMLLHGGADVDSIAADALKKTLISSYGKGIKNEAQRNLFKGLALNCPATTDLAKILEDVNAAKKTATSEKGVKLEFGSNSKEMGELAYSLRTTGGLGFNVNKAAEKSDSEDFVANLAKDISKNEAFLKDVVAKFGESVKDLGSLELGGKPDCKITELPDGKAQLVFDIKASIGRNNAFTGHCFLKVVVDPSDKTLHDAACKLKLAPSKFSARDEMPVELLKCKIVDNANKLAADSGGALTNEEVKGLMDEMSQWEDIKPGRLKEFEKWVKNDLATCIRKSINGEPLGGLKQPFEFDDDGICTQFKKDNNRSYVTIVTTAPGNPDKNGKIKDDAKVYRPGEGGEGEENKEVTAHLARVLPNKADRSFISGLMNQSTIATIRYIVENARIDADDDNSPRATEMDPDGKHAVNCHCSLTEDTSLLAVKQPKSSGKYELRIDNETNTATILITADYEVTPFVGLRGGELPQSKLGTAVSTFEIKVTGLGTGHPEISSLGFGQKLEAADM